MVLALVQAQIRFVEVKNPTEIIFLVLGNNCSHTVLPPPLL